MSDLSSRPAPVLVDTEDGLRRLRERMLSGEPVGFDLEDSGPLFAGRRGGKKKAFVNPYRATLTGYSVATMDGCSFYVPVNHTTGNAPTLGALNTLRAALDPRHVAWAWNWKHDVKIVREYAPAYRPSLCDGMVACWLAGHSSDKGTFGLKAVAETRLGVRMATFQETLGKRQQFSEIPPVEAASYAGDDAFFALCLGQTALGSLDEANRRAFFEWEMPFVWVLRDMEDAGLFADPAALRELGGECSRRLSDLQEEWDFLFPDVSIGSAPQLREHFFEGGVWSTDGILKTPKGAPKVDHESLLALEARYPANTIAGRAVRLKLEFQDLAKIVSTYTEAFIREAANYPDGRLHASFHHTGTRTGRLSSSDPNFQNIPTRSALGKRVKDAFRAKGGYAYVAADYSQIELRLLAHFAGGRLADAYREGVDVHQQTADLIGITRDQAKIVNFANIYGAGNARIGRMTGMTVSEAGAAMKRFDREYPTVAKTMKAIIGAADARGYVRTLLHRRRYIPELQKGGALRWAGERVAKNTVIQGGASDIVKVAMVCLHRLGVPLVAQVHDELISEVPLDTAEDVARVMEREMTGVGEYFGLRVPLEAKPKTGRTLREIK